MEDEIKLELVVHEEERKVCYEAFYKNLAGDGDAYADPSTKRPSRREDITYRIGPNKQSDAFTKYHFILRSSSADSDLLEINCSRKNSKHLIAGRYLKDSEGNYYVGHVGRIKLDRNDFVVIPREILEDFPGGFLVNIIGPKGDPEDVFVLGGIDSPYLWDSIFLFMNAVVGYKQQLISGQYTPPTKQQVRADLSFTPEVTSRSSYDRTPGKVDVKCSHGVVINLLEIAIRNIGLDAFNDKQKDLFTASSHNDMTVLFEAKTSTSTTNVYTGIGQLMFHGASQNNQPKKVLVLPGTPSSETGTRLERLGIEVLEYELSGAGVKFDDETLKRILES